MTIGLNTQVRAARLDTVSAQVDADAAAGYLEVLNGTRPSTAGPATTTLATYTFGDPSFAAAVGGAMSANAIAQIVITATGTATWYRVFDGAGTILWDGDVGLTASGADLEFDSVDFVAGRTSQINTFVLNEGNL